MFRLTPLIRFAQKHRLAGGAFGRVSFVAWVLALGCVAFVGVTLFWRVFAPVSPVALPTPMTDPLQVAQELVRRRPFGGEPSPASPSAPVLSAPPSMAHSRLALHGLATGFGTAPGFALVSVDQAPPRAFVPGEELIPGVRLIGIAHGGIDIEEAGRQERLHLPAPLTGGALP